MTQNYHLIFTIAILLCSMAIAPLGWSQTILVNSLNTDAYPLMKARFSAFDTQGKEFRIFSNQGIHITEYEKQIQPTLVQCPPILPPNALSVVLAIDVSGSMEQVLDGKTNLDFAKEAVKSFINIVNFDISECAITSFNNESTTQQDFTFSSSKLLKALEHLQPNGGTNYSNGFLQPKTGALEIAKKGVNKKIIIFLTDGVGEINFQKVLDSAKKYDITIYTIGLKMLLPNELKNLSEFTKGRFYERVRTSEELTSIYKEILLTEQTNSSPCEIEWVSNDQCLRENIPLQITIPDIQATKKSTYTIPNEKIKTLKFSQTQVNFGLREAKKKFDTIITVYGINKEFSITSIETNSPYFSITPKSLTLAKNDSAQLRLTFEPPDSQFYSTKIVVFTTECNFELFVNGGIPKETSQLKLISPNGGEMYGVYSDTIIRWEGISNDEKVLLEFSTNNGLSWQTIENEAINNVYKWRAISPKESNQCLVRVSQRSKFPYPKDFSESIKGRINDIAWSPSSNQVSVCVDFNEVIIIDIHSREKKSLLDKTKSFGNGSFSPDNKFLAINGISGVFHIIDVNTMTIQKSVPATGLIYSLQWSPDGTKIATVNSLGLLEYFDSNGNKLSTHQLPDNTIPYVTQKRLFWNNVGTRIAYIESFVDNSDSGRVFVYDFNSMKQIGYKAFSFRYVYSYFFSEDGKHITIVTDRIAETWEVENSNTVQSFPYKTDYRQMSISYNKQYVMYLWDLYRGYIPSLYNDNQDFEYKTFTKHRATLQVNWSPNSKYFVTSDFDSTFRFFVVEPDVVQSDVSDSTFTTIAPIFTPIVVNMDTVEIPKYKDSVVIGTMKLNTPFPIVIDSVSVTNDFVISLFKIIGERKDLLIEKDKLFPLEFRYNPIFIGRNEARYTYYIGDKVIATAPIIGFAIDSIFTRLASQIDMGEVLLGSSKDSLSIRTVRNVNIRHIPIRSIRIVGSNDFTLLSSPDPFTLNRTQTLMVDIRFTPSRGGLIQAMLEIEYDGPNSPLYIPIIGVGLTDGEFLLVAEDVHTNVVSKVDVPIVLKQRNATVPLSEITASFDIEYRPTVAIAQSGLPQKINDTTSSIRITNIPLTPGVVTKIPFQTGLGDRPFTIVGLSNLEVSSPLDISTKDGSITLLGICEEGGTRLLNPTGRTGVVALTVKEGRIELELDRSEAGSAQLTLTNQIGQIVHSSTLQHTEQLRTQESISTINFSSGVYYLTFNTATTTQTVPIFLIK